MTPQRAAASAGNAGNAGIPPPLLEFIADKQPAKNQYVAESLPADTRTTRRKAILHLIPILWGYSCNMFATVEEP